MGDNKDSIGLVLLGLTLGTILAFILLTRKPQAVSAQPPIQQQYIQPIQQYDLQYNWQPTDIPRVDDVKQAQFPVQMKTIADCSIQIDPQLTQMTSQLGKATYQLEQAAYKLQETISRMQQSTYQQYQPSQPQYIVLQPQTIPQTPVMVQSVQPTQTPEQIKQDNDPQLKTTADYRQPSLNNTIYKNAEKWEIKRGPDGRIKALNIIRDVQKNS